MGNRHFQVQLRHYRKTKVSQRAAIQDPAQPREPDTTIQIKSERDLKTCGERLNLGLLAAHQGFYEYNFQTKKVIISQDGEPIFGFGVGVFLDEKEVFARMHPEDYQPILTAFQGYLQRKFASFAVQLRVRGENGDWMWVLTLGKVVEWDENDQPARFIGTYTDITNFKLAESALRESEERYRSLFENSIDANILSTREGEILAVNPEACRIFGYTREEMLRLTREDIIDVTSDQFGALLAELICSGKYRGEASFIRRDGTCFTGEVAIAAFQSQNGQFRHSVIIRDITERKRTEDALLLDDARLEALYTLSQEKFLNDEELSKYALDKAVELTGSDIGYLYFTREQNTEIEKFYWSSSLCNDCTIDSAEHHPLDRAGVWADCIRLRRPVVQNDFQSCPDRQGYPENHPPVYRHMSIPVISDGQVVLVAGVGNKELPYDDADVRQLQLFAEGVWSVIYRMRDQTRLKKTLAEKEVLLREVHHRVKNNLQAMIALMNFQKAQVNDPDTQRFLLELQQQARTMSLVYEMLYQTENLSRVDMAVFLRQITANLLDAYSGYQHVTLQVDCDSLLMSVEVATPLGLIVNELVTNALKYAFPAGFQGEKRIHVSLKDQEGPIVLEVNDNGVGLPSDADHQKPKSTGLNLVNLWTTYQLGARLEIQSRPGTHFLITLPNL